jgi:hypothetical protein
MTTRSESVDDEIGDTGLSRRALLGGAGAVVGGAVLAAGTAALAPDVAAAAPEGVATGKPGSTVTEFVARIDQAGAHLIAYGYLTSVAGLRDAELFSDLSNRTEGTALYTAFADGTLAGRSVDGSVHSLDVLGSLDVYHRAAAGASFADPSSFKTGTLVASYALELQDILTVIAPDTGLPTLTGDMLQTRTAAAQRWSHPFGQRDLRLRFFATGIGNRSEPTAPQAHLSVAGNFTVAG